ncbi:MAG TPA: hypothetical protein HA348_07240 [Thermoplasmata archaeon]|nr:hypothetical protein [Thermoplasmata archaeon]
MRFKRLFIIGLVLSILLGSCGCVRSITKHSKFYKEKIATEPFERKVVNEGKVEKIGQGINEITVLYVKGTPYEMGFQHGKLLRDDIRKCIDGVLNACYEFVGKEVKLPLADRTLANFLLDEAYKKMEPYIPNDYKEEMEGLADGSGVSLKDIHRLHALPGLTETSCSAFAAFGNATEDGNLYQLRILDYIIGLGIQDYPVITVYQPNEGNSFVNIGWAGFTGVISGMNDKGIAISEKGYGGPGEESPGILEPQPKETIEGIPMIFLLKKVLQHANSVDEATGIMKSADKTNYFVYVVGDGITEDGKPNVRGFISTRESFKVYTPNEHNFPIPQLEDIIYSSHDNEKCYQLLKKLHGKIDPSIIIEKINPAIAMKSNLQCVVYDPKNLRFWVANAEGKNRACEQQYVLFDFRKVLKNF